MIFKTVLNFEKMARDMLTDFECGLLVEKGWALVYGT